MEQTLTKKVKLKLNYLQKIKIETLSNEHRILYNHLLDYCRKMWYSGKGADFKGINEEYKKFKEEKCLTINSKSAQNTSRILINNIKSFYNLRKKEINNAKFPGKFKSYKIFCTFMLDYNCGNGGFKFENNILSLLLKRKSFLDIKLSKFVNIKENQITSLFFTKEKSNYYVSITYKEKCFLQKENDNFISIDLGVSNIVTCYSNKINNLQIQNSRFFKLEKQANKLQSKLDKKKKYSKKYKRIKLLLNKKQRKISNKNKDFQHKISRKIINICKENEIHTLVVGDIKVKKCKIKHKKGLNKSTQGRGTLGRFKNFLQYKASISGLNFKLINEAYTSQTNCLTGKREFNSDLDIRDVEVIKDIFIDRDLNSAVNIFKRYKDKWTIHLQDLLNLDKMYMNNNSCLYMTNL